MGASSQQTPIDGPTLRSVRESMAVPLRQIARKARMSHGHLSKVERGEYGRPVTPAVLFAYQQVLGVTIDDDYLSTLGRPGDGARSDGWRPGQLSEPRQLAYLAAVGAMAVGAPIGEPVTRVLDHAGVTIEAPRIGAAEVEQLHHLTHVLDTLDLRHAGQLAGPLAQVLLRWLATQLYTPPVSQPVAAGLHRSISLLAARAAWWQCDRNRHDAARHLFRLALYAAVRSGEPDLRARLLADIAAHHGHVGYHDGALQVLRLAEGDERLSKEAYCRLGAVRAQLGGRR